MNSAAAWHYSSLALPTENNTASEPPTQTVETRGFGWTNSGCILSQNRHISGIRRPYARVDSSESNILNLIK